MLRKMLVVVAFGAAVIAGCGGGGSSNDPNIKAAVSSCKSSIDAQTVLKADTKADLKKICDKAGSGDIKDAQEASKEVCEKIVKDTVPAGAAQDQAKQACEKTAP